MCSSLSDINFWIYLHIDECSLIMLDHQTQILKAFSFLKIYHTSQKRVTFVELTKMVWNPYSFQSFFQSCLNHHLLLIIYWQGFVSLLQSNNPLLNLKWSADGVLLWYILWAMRFLFLFCFKRIQDFVLKDKKEIVLKIDSSVSSNNSHSSPPLSSMFLTMQKFFLLFLKVELFL